ncbi:hypothetical protein JG688_00013309 [Phytophthora aleatoria]|uniref:Uncharacterized protein n=1 Tax=Phytophthora aleatoria TaxID=2496075 RepID=A0A8J5I9W2_9STRA|nr:hypothetical protein JG688_00013309 [Phytophthora aleatoria]
MALHTYGGIRFGGEVAPNLEAISDVLGIHGVRSVATGRGEEGVTGVGAFSSSSLRERFELEALGSSSRCRRDHVSGSCVATTDWESAAEDGTSPSSMGTSLMSDPLSVGMLPSVFHTDEPSRIVSGAAALSSTRFLYCSAWYSPTKSLDSVVEVVVPAVAGTDVVVSAEADSCTGIFVCELIME